MSAETLQLRWVEVYKSIGFSLDLHTRESETERERGRESGFWDKLIKYANVFCALVFCPLHEALREGPENRHKKGLDEVLFLGLFNCFPCAIDKQVTTPPHSPSLRAENILWL